MTSAIGEKREKVNSFSCASLPFLSLHYSIPPSRISLFLSSPSIDQSRKLARVAIHAEFARSRGHFTHWSPSFSPPFLPFTFNPFLPSLTRKSLAFLASLIISIDYFDCFECSNSFIITGDCPPVMDQFRTAGPQSGFLRKAEDVTDDVCINLLSSLYQMVEENSNRLGQQNVTVVG